MNSCWAPTSRRLGSLPESPHLTLATVSRGGYHCCPHVMDWVIGGLEWWKNLSRKQQSGLEASSLGFFLTTLLKGRWKLRGLVLEPISNYPNKIQMLQASLAFRSPDIPKQLPPFLYQISVFKYLNLYRMFHAPPACLRCFWLSPSACFSTPTTGTPLYCWTSRHSKDQTKLFSKTCSQGAPLSRSHGQLPAGLQGLVYPPPPSQSARSACEPTTFKSQSQQLWHSQRETLFGET